MGLLGRSARTMVWTVLDPGPGLELILVMPRRQPPTLDALRQWNIGARRAAGLVHPNLASAVEISSHSGWPYVAYDPAGATTLTARLPSKPLTPSEAAAAMHQLGEAVAYAHESGAVHADIQGCMVLLDDAQTVRLMGLGVDQDAIDPAETQDHSRAASVIAHSDRLRVLRSLAQRDVLALGLLLHQALSGHLPLDETDVASVIARLPPAGRDIVRLPWNTPRPIPDALRAIANRATDRQERQRYRSARTLVHALEGFLQTDTASDTGALALLIGRLGSVGVLPASPGGAERAARLAMMERGRTAELAAVVLQDMALSFELIRAVNTAFVRGAQVAGTGPVLTVRRAIAMLGLDGVRRAALSLRSWPGPLDERGAHELLVLMQRVQRAGRVAKALRPPAWDAEVVALVTMLQNLGPLVIQYHFPEDAAQIRKLMRSVPSLRDGVAEEPGMSEQAACFAVIGIDLDSVGGAVARHWGLGEGVAQMIRRLPTDAHVHAPRSDEEYLRTLASCANEISETATHTPEKARASLARVAQRYAQALGVSASSLQDALNASRLDSGVDVTDLIATAHEQPSWANAAGSLREG
jgi:non-specific serine/threonine protein kinase